MNRSRAPKDRDAELDEALRKIGNEMLQEEVPSRLQAVLRAAAAAAERAREKPEDEAPDQPPANEASKRPGEQED